MAASLRSLVDRGGSLPNHQPSISLLSVDDGIGVIAIEGPILRKPDLVASVFFGATSSEDIGAALREAGSRYDIKAVFLNIASPCGTVAGTPELATAVASLNVQKPVYAFSSGLMCSAAYWVASQARVVYATHPEAKGPHACHATAQCTRHRMARRNVCRPCGTPTRPVSHEADNKPTINLTKGS